MNMGHEGPQLEVLTHRLLVTPVDFLDEPRVGIAGRVEVAALVNDLLLLHGARAPAAVLDRFKGGASSDRNRLALIMIATWLLADDWFVVAKIPQANLLSLLTQDITELASGAPAHKFATDADRREEVSRVVLSSLGYRPAGESVAQATDRLSSISGPERRRLLNASREAEARARKIREALAQKSADESADKWTRE